MKLIVHGLVLIWLLMFSMPFGWSQEYTIGGRNFGVNGGVTGSFGSHVKRIGFAVSGYIWSGHWQGNAMVRITWSSLHLGPVGGSRELVGSIGSVYGFHETSAMPNYFVHIVSSQMPFKYTIGYAYNFYWDTWDTSQRTGSVGLTFGPVEFIHENDALGMRSDRYRTAALQLAYRTGHNRFGISSVLWTGNTNDRLVSRVDSAQFARFGYKDLSKAKYGKISHGLLSAQWDRAVDYGQSIRANLGIDAEQVRNAIQNKLMHDMYLWPQKWNTAQNPHIPMLDDKGFPYLDEKGQVLRPARVFFQAGVNELLFY